MRVVIVGGGMAGLVLARGLVHRGVQPTVIERMPSSVVVEGPIMLPFQAYEALEEIRLLDHIRAAGRDVPPIRNGEPVAINVARQFVLEALREGLEVLWEQEVTDLLHEGDRVEYKHAAPSQNASTKSPGAAPGGTSAGMTVIEMFTGALKPS